MTRKEMYALRDMAKKCSESVRAIVFQETYCREMIMSCLVYSHDSRFYNEETDELGERALPYWVGNPKHYSGCVFTKEDLVRMFKEQKEEFEKGECSISGTHDLITYKIFAYSDEL